LFFGLRSIFVKRETKNKQKNSISKYCKKMITRPMELNTHLLDRNKERIVNSDLKSKKVLVLEETESGFMRVVDLKVG